MKKIVYLFFIFQMFFTKQIYFMIEQKLEIPSVQEKKLLTQKIDDIITKMVSQISDVTNKFFETLKIGSEQILNNGNNNDFANKTNDELTIDNIFSETYVKFENFDLEEEGTIFKIINHAKFHIFCELKEVLSLRTCEYFTRKIFSELYCFGFGFNHHNYTYKQIALQLALRFI